MGVVDTKQAQQLLNANGFPCGIADGIPGPKTAAALKRFQQASAFVGLEQTGRLDAATGFALEQLPNLSPNFTTHELRSPTRSAQPPAERDGPCYVKRELLWAAETLRTYLGRPLRIVSGYRSWEYHTVLYRRLGRPVVKGSWHLKGGAIDIPSAAYQLHINDCRELELFSGIGYQARTGWVSHVDVRHRLGGGRSPLKPATWRYQ